MSMVGPRPERPEFVTMLEEEVPYWSRRLLMKPGVTGWAQVRCGYATDSVSSAEKLSYDFWYMRHNNLAVDFAVCIRTLLLALEVLSPRHAAPPPPPSGERRRGAVRPCCSRSRPRCPLLLGACGGGGSAESASEPPVVREGRRRPPGGAGALPRAARRRQGLERGRAAPRPGRSPPPRDRARAGDLRRHATVRQPARPPALRGAARAGGPDRGAEPGREPGPRRRPRARARVRRPRRATDRRRRRDPGVGDRAWLAHPRHDAPRPSQAQRGRRGPPDRGPGHAARRRPPVPGLRRAGRRQRRGPPRAAGAVRDQRPRRRGRRAGRRRGRRWGEPRRASGSATPARCGACARARARGRGCGPAPPRGGPASRRSTSTARGPASTSSTSPRDSTFRSLRIGPRVRVGLTAEWADPAWGRRPASVGNVIEDSRFESRLVGVYLDEGTTRTTVRRSTFANQTWGAIGDYRGKENAFYGNDYGGARRPARPSQLSQGGIGDGGDIRVGLVRRDRVHDRRLRGAGRRMGRPRARDAAPEPVPAARLAGRVVAPLRGGGGVRRPGRPQRRAPGRRAPGAWCAAGPVCGWRASWAAGPRSCPTCCSRRTPIRRSPGSCSSGWPRAGVTSPTSTGCARAAASPPRSAPASG